MNLDMVVNHGIDSPTANLPKTMKRMDTITGPSLPITERLDVEDDFEPQVGESLEIIDEFLLENQTSHEKIHTAQMMDNLAE